MLALQNIYVSVHAGTPLERNILDNLDLCVKKGEFVTLIGGNGAGKSTVLNVISGALKVSQGQVMIQGKECTHNLNRAGYVAKVSQDPAQGTLGNLTVEENLAFAFSRGRRRTLLPLMNARRRAFLRDQLAVLGIGLENRLKELVSHFSGGQRQALSLVMAMLAPSAILLLDEHTAALDPQMAEKVMQLTEQLVADTRKTTVMVTHNMAHALRYGTRTLVIRKGRVGREVASEERSQLKPEALAAFMVAHL